MDGDKFITQEIGVYEQKLVVLNEIKGKVAEATRDLESSYTSIIFAKDEFEKIKKQNIEELRTYKYAIAQESKEIAGFIASIGSALSSVNAKDVLALSDALKTLAALGESGLLKRLRALSD